MTDFCSYYHLPSSVFECAKHKRLGAVYSYYNVATTMTYTQLMNEALILSKISGEEEWEWTAVLCCSVPCCAVLCSALHYSPTWFPQLVLESHQRICSFVWYFPFFFPSYFPLTHSKIQVLMCSMLLLWMRMLPCLKVSNSEQATGISTTTCSIGNARKSSLQK